MLDIIKKYLSYFSETFFFPEYSWYTQPSDKRDCSAADVNE